MNKGKLINHKPISDSHNPKNVKERRTKITKNIEEIIAKARASKSIFVHHILNYKFKKGHY